MTSLQVSYWQTLLGSVRFRLTVWYCLVLLGTMATLAVILYFVARGELIHHHDAELVRAASAVEHIVCEHEDCAQLTPEQRGRLDAIGGLILVHDIGGESQIFYRSQASDRFPLPAGMLDSPDVSRQEPWFEIEEAGDSLVRVYSAPYRSRAGRAGLIRVMEPLGDVEEPLETLRDVMLLLAPVGLLVAFAGGLWLAGRALRPVDHVTMLARDIEAHDLSRRLPVLSSHDELGRLVATINQMLGRLESSFAGMQRFTADASHELRTPLTSIVGTIDVVLAKRRTVDEHEDALRSIAEDVQGLRIIVDDLLVLAQADSGVDRMRKEPVRLDEVVRDVAESFETAALAAGVVLRVDAAVEAHVIGDEPWLRQLVSNLLDNAIKFAKPSAGAAGHVRVELRTVSHQATLTVSDDGPGIADADLPRVFDRFFRSDTARTRGEGVGLGLAIARWVASAHGGDLSATNIPAGGARFTLRLPLAMPTET